ncbi:MAG: ribulose-phosphate 3-epimerase [Candidatus Methanomethylophilaceae archaeon]|nr:ribulose-phosphate 3-epimerase [Candidatus Methanomethylophilaceae archaeon]MDI3541887.1 ribulose-phosphate 3-epimerase [Candidatus Methanomethylophilaceae archaeon]
MIKIAPSMLSADAARLGEELQRIERCGADWAHIDVMDGVFVPNITIGQHVVRALRPYSKIPFDVHLMIVNPIKHIPAFLEAGSDIITIHVETTEDVASVLTSIKDGGAKAGLSLNPYTPLETVIPYLDSIDLLLVMSVQPGFGGQKFFPHCLKKIAEASKAIDEVGAHIEISVDGGINRETGKRSSAAGATVLTAGSALFSAKDMETEIRMWKGFPTKEENNESYG